MPVPPPTDDVPDDDRLIVRAILGASPEKVPPRALLVASPHEALAAVTRLREARRAGKLWVGRYGDCDLAVAAHGWGAPAAAIFLEAMARCGVTDAIRVGACGAIGPQVALGDVVLAAEAYPQEGTSPHYPARPPGGPYAADPALLARAEAALGCIGAPLHRGPVVSFDALFRERPELLAAWRRNGILAVDMETSAVYAVASFLGLRAAALLHAADRPLDGMKFYYPRAVASRGPGLNRVLAAALEALADGPD